MESLQPRAVEPIDRQHAQIGGMCVCHEHLCAMDRVGALTEEEVAPWSFAFCSSKLC